MTPSKNSFVAVVAILLSTGCGQSPDSVLPPEKTAAELKEIQAFSHPDGKPYQTPRKFVPGADLSGKTSRDPEYVLAWHRFNSVEEYKRIGRKDSAWDADAIATLEGYASANSLPEGRDETKRHAAVKRTAAHAAKAIAAGCDDPLIRYIHTHYVIAEDDQTPHAQLTDYYGAAAETLAASDYPSIRKAFAFYRAAHAHFHSHGRPAKMHPRASYLVRGAVNYLCEALFDTSMPPNDAYLVCRLIAGDFDNTSVGRHDQFESLIPTLEKFWSEHAFAQYIIGQIYVAKAWEARGNGFVQTVTDDGWKNFEERLITAEKYLTKSFKMDPTDCRVPTKMITLLMGANGNRKEMEIWFERAMTIDTNCYDAAWAKSYYLEPRWHGGPDDALRFARRCVESRKWGGRVPLILPRLHANLQAYYKIDLTAYCSNPQVWQDINSAYKRFFEENPNEIGYRHDYARDAYRCGQYAIFLEQLPLFTRGTNYNFFGGRASYQAMIEHAQKQSARP